MIGIIDVNHIYKFNEAQDNETIILTLVSSKEIINGLQKMNNPPYNEGIQFKTATLTKPDTNTFEYTE
jgi:hypothetical protein